MSTFDFSPLFRSSVGFDRMLDTLEAASRVETTNNWPPYDITKAGEDDYCIMIAVAGFSPDDLTITQEHNVLMVTGQKAGEGKNHYLYRGIADRSFRRRFQLADHVKVIGADLANGLLTINLRHEIPEEMKPRRIEIATAGTLPDLAPKQVEINQQAA